MPNISGSNWGTQQLGDAGGVVTWSLAAAGSNIDAFNSSNGNSVDGSSFLDFDFASEISSALSQWSNAGNIEFMQIEDGGGAAGIGQVADIRIFFGEIPGSTLGVAFFPSSFGSAIAGDILLDTESFLNTNRDVFQALLVHEIGHALGLGHVPDNSVMTPSVSASTLQADDIDGITQIYGTQDNAPTSYVMPAFQTNMNILEASFQLTVTGNEAGNRVDGTSAAETILGAGGNDVLLGRQGNDSLNGGSGNDRLVGGAGNDSIDGGSGTNDIAEFSFTRTSATVSQNGANISITASGEVDTLTNIESYRFTDGTFTREELLTDPPVEPPVEPPVDPDTAITLTGTAGEDVLTGGTANDLISGLGGNDRLIGNAGDDTLYGGDGGDTLNAGDGDDLIFGGTTSADLRDIVFAGAGNDSVDGGYGNDEISGQEGNDTIAGGFGSDTLNGQDGNDVLTGSALSDLVFGNDGDDFVNGGFGHDQINGGAGADRFFHLGVLDHGSDFIQDYNAAEGDVLITGITGATRDDFQINTNHAVAPDGERAGDDSIQESFVIYRPTGQILWALVDGADQSSINIQIGSDTFDLLA
jgi:Ca2+-binding RTX toxin-like protein